jgi:hypothetical protein
MEYERIGFYNQNGEGLLRGTSCICNLGESNKQSYKGCACGPLRHKAAVLHVAHILAGPTFLAGTHRQEMHAKFFKECFWNATNWNEILFLSVALRPNAGQGLLIR